MTVTAWRIVKAKHASTAFTGEGAKAAGGRWNSRGVAMIYTAGSISLAMLEMLVHVRSQELLRRYVMFEVTFEETLVKKLSAKDLPRNWRLSPPPGSLQRMGDVWVGSRETPVLRVPSAIVPTEWNFLLNPNHPDFRGLAIGQKQPVRFDPRLGGTPRH